MKNKYKEILNLIAQTLYDKKGFNILALDIRGASLLTDFVLIGEGNGDRHVTALAGAISEALEGLGIIPLHVEGKNIGDWVVMDYDEFMIHLFMPGVRERYRLEELWNKGEIIDLQINTESLVMKKSC